MIDIRLLDTRFEEIEQNVKDRFMNVDVAEVKALGDAYRVALAKTEELRRQKNENARGMKGKLSPEERQALIEKGKALKEEAAAAEAELAELEAAFSSAAKAIPNFAHPDAPRGKEEKDNLEIARWGEPTKFDFEPKDHVQLAEALDLVDFERAGQISGQKFYYLKNEAVYLELALVRFAMDIVRKHGFIPTITPDIAREEILEHIGFNPRGEESNIYSIEEEGKCLIGTAEITLGAYHADRIFERSELPVRMAGYSHCFRREAGAAGQYSKGLYRVHQFSKVEMFIFCAPEDSEKFHLELRGIEEEIFQALEVPYRVVDTCTGDLGAPAYRKFDLEAWMPGRGDEGGWGEVTSTSNCTDYQARRLRIRMRPDASENHEGALPYVHLLNATALAVSRAMIAIIENHQQADGSIRMPKALLPYLHFDSIPAK